MQDVNDFEVYKYRWVVLMLACLTSCVTWGLAYTIPVHYVSWISYFDAGKGELALIGGINSGTAGLLGPLYHIIQSRLGYRQAGALSGVFMMLGFIVSSFAMNVTTLCVFYGFVMGFGYGLGYFCVSVAVNLYFTRQRALAEGIANIGSSGGGFLFTILAQYLTNTYGWRGTLLIMGAISSHLLLFFKLMYLPRQLPELSLDWASSSSPESSVNVRKLSDCADTINQSSNSMLLEQKVTSATNGGRIQEYMNTLKNPVLVLMLCAEFICWLGIYIPIMFLPERARIAGIDINTAAWIVSSIVLSMTVGRLVISALSTVFHLDPFYTYGVANALAGTLTALSPLIQTELGLLCYAMSFGFLNVSAPFIRTSAALLLGQKYFALAYGWILAMNGVALFIGPAFAGWLFDLTGSYTSTFSFSGACLITSGMLTLFKNKAVRLSHSMRIKSRAVTNEEIRSEPTS